jgi:hypothetical protein
LGGVAICRKSRVDEGHFGAFPEAPVIHGTAIVAPLGSALFAPSIANGLLFLAGLAYSNWRHALVGLLGAFGAVELVAEVSVVGRVGTLGGAIKSGFAGFNGRTGHSS